MAEDGRRGQEVGRERGAPLAVSMGGVDSLLHGGSDHV